MQKCSLCAVLEVLDSVSDEVLAFLNRRTGETTWLFQEDIDAAESGEDGFGFGAAEDVELVKKVLPDPDWLELPSSRDIDQWDMMERFVYGLPEGARRDRLEDAIHGRGAFRRFSDTAGRFGLLDSWYAFRAECYAELAMDWLEARDVPFVDDRGATKG